MKYENRIVVSHTRHEDRKKISDIVQKLDLAVFQISVYSETMGGLSACERYLRELGRHPHQAFTIHTEQSGEMLDDYFKKDDITRPYASRNYKGPESLIAVPCNILNQSISGHMALREQIPLDTIIALCKPGNYRY